jgi:hypothetical protein
MLYISYLFGRCVGGVGGGAILESNAHHGAESFMYLAKPAPSTTFGHTAKLGRNGACNLSAGGAALATLPLT